jgi:peptidylprolyl isomerase
MFSTRRALVPAALVAAALSLSACAASEANPTPTASGGGATLLDSVEWTDTADAGPELTFDTPISFDSPAVSVLAEGDGEGEPVDEGTQVSLDLVVYDGATGETIFNTFTDNGVPQVLNWTEAGLEPTFYNAMLGLTVGAKLLYAAVDPTTPAEDGSLSTQLIAVTIADVVDVPSRAEGTAVTPEPGLPVVTLDDSGAPSIDFAGTEMPDALVAQTLIEGAGPAAEENQQVTVHYTGWLWNGEVFDSSWSRGAPSTFGLTRGGLIDGWLDGLVGVPVGSQVLLVVPPELGYGDEGNGSIPGGATLVFVVDILAAA